MTDHTDPVAAALALVDALACDPELSAYGQAVQTIAAEVRRLRDNDVRTINIVEAAVRSPSISDYVEHWEGRCLKAESDLAARREQRCETCRHQTIHPYRSNDPFCALTRMTDGVHPTVTTVPCRFLGGGCLAWARREP